MPSTSSKTLTAASLFTGVGGFDLGFQSAGIQTMWMCEKDKACQSVLKRHWPEVPIYDDITELQPESLIRPDILTGGFPCQDVSVAGRREGLAGERSGLWFEFHRIIERVKPQWAVIENVPGLLSSNDGRDFATIIHGLVKCGYRVAWRVLDAQYFGVAQSRRRVFVVGSLGNGAAAGAVFDDTSIGWDKEAANIKERKDYPGDESGYLFGNWWNGKQVSQTLDAVLYKKQALPEKNRFPAVMVPAWQRCPCCEDYWCNIHHMHAFECDCPPVEEWGDIYPYEPTVLRWITPIEAERLQGFPDNWTDGQSDSTRYHQLGNAVVPQIAEWLGRRIMEVERGES